MLIIDLRHPRGAAAADASLVLPCQSVQSALILALLFLSMAWNFGFC